MDTSAESKSRLLIVLLAAASSFMIFMTTERCFIRADIRNAITMVKTLRAYPGAATIPETIAQTHGNIGISEIHWDGEVTDNCYGFVRVRAAVPAPGEVLVYLYDVNLSGQRLHPANELANKLMQQIKSSNKQQPTDQPTSAKEGSAPDN